MAAKVFEPCYIGDWSAAECWDLTEQVFREVVVVTSRQSLAGPGRSTLFRCPNCLKQFRRQKRDLTLRPHKTPQGYDCRGRRG